MRGWTIAAGMALAASLSGCSDDPATDQKDVDAVEARALAAVDGVVHDAMDGTGPEFVSGRHRFVTCGDGLAAGGVIHRVSLNFGPSDEPVEDMVDAAASAMEADGWTVKRVENPAIVEGSRDGDDLRFQFGPAGTQVSIGSSCVDTSNDVANDYQDRGYTDLTWK
ncbi:hypothetical protein ACOACQ_04500 [Nocardioides sp. CPCC 206347]|uniref:hypothetical protein n=1 Tax=Nocardioides sp. CPCC 206347 TaxID=3406463 RepID=UPI003B4381BD